MSDTVDNSVQVDLISKSRMKDMAQMEKIRLILDSVKNNNIVILEEGLDPEEESKLIEVTMTEIQPDGFSGIEIESYPDSDDSKPGLFKRMLNKNESSGNRLTVIGPSGKIETLEKDESIIKTLISSGDT